MAHRAADGRRLQAAALIAKKAWGPFLFPINGHDPVVHHTVVHHTVVHHAGAPGPSTPLAAVDVVAAILWEDAYNDNS